jgi:hypothetical protein
MDTNKSITDNYNIPRKVKIFLFTITLIPLSILFSFIGYDLWFDPKSSFEYFLEAQSKINVQSKITSIYRDVENHNTLFLKFKDTAIAISPIWDNKFHIGDSISKKKGFLKIEHYRNNNLLEILDYNDIKKRDRVSD